MEPDVSATLKTRIKELLLMTKSEIPANILAVLGLHPADFIDPYIRWSAEEVVVLSKLLPQERGEKMVLHPCLLDVDLDATTSTWVYQWPHDISTFRDTLVTVFGELKNDVLWGNFVKSWAALAVLMNDPVMSLKEKVDAERAAEAALDAVTEEIAMPQVAPVPVSFDDDLDLSTPEPVPDPTVPAVNRVLDAMEDLMKEPAPEPFLVPAPYPAPDPEPEPPKRGRGRPAGLTKRARAQSQELKAEEFVPAEDPSGHKTIPALVRFADQLTQELALVDDLLRSISESDIFPKETVHALKNVLDRISNKTAHLEYKGIRDENTTGRMDGLVDVSLVNVTSIVTNALRDLELSYDRSDSWDAFGTALKSARDLAGSVETLISQPGAGPVVREAPEPVA